METETWKMQQLLVFLYVSTTVMLLLTGSTTTAAKYRAITVQIKSGLPNNTEAMQISCTSESRHRLSAGESYEWTVKTREMQRCNSIWGRFFQSWHAFQPHRDQIHRHVYWLVKEDGFYLSWDYPRKWTRKAVWESD